MWYNYIPTRSKMFKMFDSTTNGYNILSHLYINL